MADDSPEDTTPSPDSGRAKRAPPTIDLEAIGGYRRNPERRRETASRNPDPRGHRRAGRAARFPPAIIAAITGAVAAALVIAAVWFVGWPGAPVPPAPAPQADTAAIDALAARVASVEAKAAKPAAPAPDPAVAARIEALEKSVAALRGELGRPRAQSDKLAAAVDDIKSAPPESASRPDLAAINDRVAQLERATRAQTAEIAQGERKTGGRPAAAPDRGGRPARRSGSDRRSLRGGAGGGEIAGAGSGRLEAARSLSRPRACRAPRC